MEKYIFSGALTDEMHDMLIKNPEFEPMDMLESQVNRSSINKLIEWRKDGFARFLFIDSGAFSVHTGKAHTTADEYIEYLNSIDEYVDVFAQLDTIPGKFKQPKSAEDYIVSAEKSWENYLYMRTKLKSPQKLMPVYHFGEDLKYLKRMLDWKDSDGNPLTYIGLSPANDASKEGRMIYLKDMYSFIAKSSNPNVKTHIYGFTALEAMSKFPCYSADSITHRLLAGYGKIISRNFGVISVTTRVRSNNNKSGMSFIDAADDLNLSILKSEIEGLGFTLDQIKSSPSARVAVNILNIQYLSKTKYKYKSSNLVTSKKLFNID